MMERNMSYHLMDDRAKRTEFIIDNIGFGEVVKEKFYMDEKNGKYWRQLTDTGILIVLNEEHKIIVTMWIATMKQATDIFDGRRLPNYLYKKVMKNQQYIMK